jgi:zinc/manganese transport system substrate-binding protein
VQRASLLIVLGIIALVVVGGYVGVTALYQPGQKQVCGTGGAVKVVAAENFWGSLVSQLGGNHLQVTSIVTDPNADPHEYESNVGDAQAISSACFVIVNGAGYDSWALKILAAQNNSQRVVLNVQTKLGLPLDVNPHFWYSPYYVNDTLHAMYADLLKVDPGDGSYFESNYVALNQTLGTATGQSIGTRILEIARGFAGTKVGATEDIFVYMANATKLDLISPPDFMQAVSEGNEPPTPSVAEFEQQIQNGSIKLLVYNEQTVTQLTSNIKSLAAESGVPVVGVTETIQPQDATFQSWMYSELIYLQNALNANALGQ